MAGLNLHTHNVYVYALATLNQNTLFAVGWVEGGPQFVVVNERELDGLLARVGLRRVITSAGVGPVTSPNGTNFGWFAMAEFDTAIPRFRITGRLHEHGELLTYRLHTAYLRFWGGVGNGLPAPGFVPFSGYRPGHGVVPHTLFGDTGLWGGFEWSW